MSTSDGGSYYHQAACKLDPNSHPVTAFFHVFWCQLSQVRFPPEANLRHVNMQGIYYGLLLKPTLTKIEKGSRIGQRENLSCDPILSHPTGSSEAGTTLKSPRVPQLEQGMEPLLAHGSVSPLKEKWPWVRHFSLSSSFHLNKSLWGLTEASHLPVALPATGRCGGQRTGPSFLEEDLHSGHHSTHHRGNGEK